MSPCCARPSAAPRLSPTAHTSKGFPREGGGVVPRVRAARGPQWRPLCGGTPSASYHGGSQSVPCLLLPWWPSVVATADSAVTVTWGPTYNITGERARARVARARAVAASLHR